MLKNQHGILIKPPNGASHSAVQAQALMVQNAKQQLVSQAINQRQPPTNPRVSPGSPHTVGPTQQPKDKQQRSRCVLTMASPFRRRSDTF